MPMSVPSATMRSPRMATACASGILSSTVTILPLRNTREAGSTAGVWLKAPTSRVNKILMCFTIAILPLCDNQIHADYSNGCRRRDGGALDGRVWFPLVTNSSSPAHHLDAHTTAWKCDSDHADWNPVVHRAWLRCVFRPGYRHLRSRGGLGPAQGVSLPRSEFQRLVRPEPSRRARVGAVRERSDRERDHQRMATVGTVRGDVDPCVAAHPQQRLGRPAQRS